MPNATVRYPVEFDSETHTYRVNGDVVPGVTTIIRMLSDNRSVPVELMERAGVRGSAVHLLTEMYDKAGSRYQFTVDEDEYEPYMDAYRKFLAEHEVRWVGIEERLYHPTCKYAGTADRIGYVDGELGVLDIKTSYRLHPEVGPQLAGYQEAANVMRTEPLTHRWALRLGRDGTYEFRRYESEMDWSAFLACLQIYLWKRENGATRRTSGAQLSAKEHAAVLEWISEAKGEETDD